MPLLTTRSQLENTKIKDFRISRGPIVKPRHVFETWDVKTNKHYFLSKTKTSKGGVVFKSKRKALEYQRENKGILRFRYKTEKRKVIVVRKSTGLIQSWRYQKGSGIKTKSQALAIYGSNNTLYKDKVRVGDRTLQAEGVRDPTRIGKNTGSVFSKRPAAKGNDAYQWSAFITWPEGKKSRGFSNLVNEARKGLTKGRQIQAFDRAIGDAVTNQIITYEYDVQMATDTRGVATLGNTTIWFNVKYEVQTFLRLKPKDDKPKKKRK